MFPSREVLKAADVLVAKDAPWQSELRLRQAKWREQLGQPAGLAGQRRLGSRLPAGDTTNNFLTPAVARAVAAAREDPGALISAPRIYDNMLSSQPLAFNLFAELQQDLDLAAVVGRALWPDLIESVESIRFEWSPGRADPQFLGNRSAFDVAWLCRDRTGTATCVGIEVKYHEDLSQDPGSPDSPRYSAVAAASGVFRDPDEPALRALPLRQIWFDHLLALSMTRGDGPVARSRFVLLAPAINEAVNAVDVRYRSLLRDALTYERRTLEELTAVMAAVTSADWIRSFQRRYLTPSTRMS
ncbi:hypothetical protein E9549_15035 [Blastococcus sp. MG754426]|uniref:PGN_0703 family putative restriction endonuclease n=1 Tax=unclassified Blastococcus TaxID=2619396 RepID=UPI001EF08E51|nr:MULTISPECIES: hypothetical protein [unclassified Blastococcus]MCF6508709.1 hypothetical protein [Blastococcus sp. MG754426]MCF6513318.1 hypothetical protein [Blastococcus sp. MG754427]MCF6734067.1 hypothetical protein [Blastococcus sp. KM273129]